MSTLRKAMARRPQELAFAAVVAAVSLFFIVRLGIALVAMLTAPLIQGPAPAVGDVLQISTGGDGDGIRVAAQHLAGPWAPPGAMCRLDVARMAQPGGALTVQAVRRDGVGVLWAGGPTAAGAADCGNGQLILIAPADYQRLLATQDARPTR